MRRMKNRRSFLAAVVSGGVGFALLAGEAKAQEAPPSASPSGSIAKPSPAALAAATAFRAFDPKLSDEEIVTIAKGIDDNRMGAALNPKKKRLRNSDEPVTRFAAAERLA